MKHPSVVTIGAKVPAELALTVDRAILADPMAYRDRSEFVRTAIRWFLVGLGFMEKSCMERPVNPQTPLKETSESLEGPFAVNRKNKQP